MTVERARLAPWPAPAPWAWHGSRVRGLTLHRPWDRAIILGGKNVENRSRRWHLPAAGILVALHAGVHWSREGVKAIRKLWPGVAELEGFAEADDRVSTPGFPCRVIVAVAWIGPAVEPTDARVAGGWATGPWCYPIHQLRALVNPIPCRGWQGPCPIAPAIEERLLAAWSPLPQPVMPDPRPAPPHVEQLGLFQPERAKPRAGS